MLDQLPVLADVQRFMDELAVAEVPEPTSLPPTLLLEQVRGIWMGNGAVLMAKMTVMRISPTTNFRIPPRLTHLTAFEWVVCMMNELGGKCEGEDYGGS